MIYNIDKIMMNVAMAESRHKRVRLSRRLDSTMLRVGSGLILA